LNRCLAALLAQDYDAGEFEIVIADDAASDQTKRIVEWWSQSPVNGNKTPCLSYIPVIETQGPAAARNAGWRAACGEIIAFTDDDCIPDPRWLTRGVSEFRNGIVGVQGRIVMPLPLLPTDYERDASHLERSEFVTANCFLRRDTLQQLDGFDENFALAWREDSDLFFTLLEKNHQLVYAPDAIVVHPIRPGTWGISIRQQRKAMYNALLYKKHPRLYRSYVQASPPLHYYAIVLSLIAAALSAVFGFAPVAVLGVVMWFVLTAVFCYWRLRRNSHSWKHIAEMIVTSIVIPPLSLYWRLRGAVKFRVPFL
jgi:cellulose synthase/poly-beta-1,6-N-acetylglucosamine synthase-like glycosyltransferase